MLHTAQPKQAVYLGVSTIQLSVCMLTDHCLWHKCTPSNANGDIVSISTNTNQVKTVLTRLVIASLECVLTNSGASVFINKALATADDSLLGGSGSLGR